MIDVFRHGVDIAVVSKRIAEERLSTDDIEGNLVLLECLSGFLDVGTIVSRLVGHEHDQQLAVFADQVSVVFDNVADRSHGVLNAGWIDLEMLDRPTDLVDVLARLFEHVVNPLAEPNNRMVECTGRLLGGLDVELQFAGNAIKLLDDGPLVVLHAGRLIEEPDDGQLVVFQMAEDLAGQLVEGHTNFLDVEDRVAGDFATAAQIGGGRGR